MQTGVVQVAFIQANVTVIMVCAKVRCDGGNPVFIAEGERNTQAAHVGGKAVEGPTSFTRTRPGVEEATEILMEGQTDGQAIGAVFRRHRKAALREADDHAADMHVLITLCGSAERFPGHDIATVRCRGACVGQMDARRGGWRFIKLHARIYRAGGNLMMAGGATAMS
ncbi:hypothetical protein Amal_04064 [Acetobacter malorum]|uniref:Uncharacterized protein n=1 Tax=Acetobacter malorum TaxID=178901 RepID=A0A177FUK7_9PROT|nr:hypothetical protein Amal_04064 [Acetobacter malorum]